VFSFRAYLAHIAEKIYKKEKTETNKRQCPFNSVQVRPKIREGSPEKGKSMLFGVFTMSLSLHSL